MFWLGWAVGIGGLRLVVVSFAAYGSPAGLEGVGLGGYWCG